ncbi:MAG: RNA-directed DNA polymerase [Chlorobi bacterium]|nr:RNA-directed DNA polymerase [Chlorobiota bacterium]
MKTERFIQLRKEGLEPHFTKKSLTKLWRKKVKRQLRNSEIRDIFDYYDFNYSIESRSETIRSDVLDGAYRAQKPLVVKVEKKMGICRHLIFPHPADALVLQTITEFVFDVIKKCQPSENAFYSRDRTSRKLPHEISDDYSQDWFSQWKKMQKTILGFSESKKFVISTDIANYYDNIDLVTLREKVLGYVKEKDESGVLVDLLFRIIEDISWRPDYLPYKKQGLPIVTLESIRLLGHTFLFEVDAILKSKTKQNFTRWMDDITIGVDSRKETNEILGGMSDTLKSSGLELNLAKTHLYSSEDFAYNFLIKTNIYLDSLKEKKSLSGSEKKSFRKAFTEHLRDKKPQYWSKITKRFIHLHANFKIKISKKRVGELYVEHPVLRDKLCKYLKSMDYSSWSSKLVIEILDRLDMKDDIALFYVADLVTQWNIPVTDQSNDFINKMYCRIELKEPFHFLCALWIRTKYDHPDNLLRFVFDFESEWKKEPFLRRQVTATMSRIYKYDTEKIESALKSQTQSNDISTVSIANHILDFADKKTIEFHVNSYLFPNNLRRYTLERFLVLCSVLNSDEVRQEGEIQRKVKKFVTDKYYLRWLDVSYNIS